LGVPIRGLMHDLSKLRPREWWPYANYFYGPRYTEKERQSAKLVNIFLPSEADLLRDFNAAWNHHQHKNDHHWQYWVLMFDDGGTEILPMSHNARREMLADWRGAGKALGKPDTRAWYLANKDKMKLHAWTREWIEEQLMAAV
jgi:hypothetical protein